VDAERAKERAKAKERARARAWHPSMLVYVGEEREAYTIRESIDYSLIKQGIHLQFFVVILYLTIPNAPTLHLQIFADALCGKQSQPVLIVAALFTILILLGCGVGVK
jgi:hypothetical protein